MVALGRLGWPLRRIEEATGVRRETASAYLKAAGIAIRPLAAIAQGYKVTYREAHVLLEELADATLDGTRKAYLAELAAVPLLILDDLGMRKLPRTAAEDLLELVMRRYERASTLLTSNRPVDDWGKLSATPPPRRPCSTASSTTPTS